MSRSMGKSGHDDSLLSSMAARLRKVEEELQQKTKELEDKDKQLHEYRRSLGAEKNKDKVVDYLKSECYKANRQIQEMEEFLADYGMIWVGEETNSNYYKIPEEEEDGHDEDEENDNGDLMTKNTSWTQSDSVSVYKPDFSRILHNIHELSILGGDGVGVVEKGPDGITRVKQPDPIPLTLYANGLLMFSGPFRPYTDPSTQQMMKDFEEGYFPSELQAKYPKGMPIKVKDQIEKEYTDRRVNALFPGRGNALTDAAKELAHIRGIKVPEPDDDTKPAARDDGTAEHPQSVERFLNKLPSNVIRDGKILDIRSSIGELIGKGSSKNNNNNIEVAETAVVKQIQTGEGSGGDQGPVATLRVKLDGGSKTLIVKLRYTDTIQDVRTFVDKQKHNQRYEIRTTFPNRVYDVRSETLEDAGLVPSATLHIKDL